MGETFVARDLPVSRPAVRILVYGAGAVGSFLAARLGLTGADVTLLGRPATVASLASTGLALETDGRTFVALVRAVATVDAVRTPPDLVFLAVKSYDTEAALPDLKRLAAMGATICTMQNGVGNEEMLMDALGAEHVLSGAITISVSMPEPGLVVQHTGEGGVAFAPVPGGPSPGTALAIFDEAGVPAVGVASYHDLKWSKLLLNLLANAQAAILDSDASAVVNDRVVFGVEQRAFREALCVMRRVPARPIALPGYDVPKLALAMRVPQPVAWRLLKERIGGGRGEKRPSLALDLARGKRRTEVDWLNGAVEKAAGGYGIRTPVNATLAALVQELASDPAACPPVSERRAWLQRSLRERGVRVRLT
ncbi:MAG: ketopantoate reductase family protein [Thermomicrobiales bacterium]